MTPSESPEGVNVHRKDRVIELGSHDTKIYADSAEQLFVSLDRNNNESIDREEYSPECIFLTDESDFIPLPSLQTVWSNAIKMDDVGVGVEEFAWALRDEYQTRLLGERQSTIGQRKWQ